jgi:hypothetical protein
MFSSPQSASVWYKCSLVLLSPIVYYEFIAGASRGSGPRLRSLSPSSLTSGLFAIFKHFTQPLTHSTFISIRQLCYDSTVVNICAHSTADSDTICQMKSLKNKGKQAFYTASDANPLTRGAASRFFRDMPSQDEKVANAVADGIVDFDAGIQGRSVKNKRKIHVTAKVVFTNLSSVSLFRAQERQD